MGKLLKCPFCGGEAKIVKYCGKKTIVYVECSNCLAYMGNQRIMTSSSRGKEYFESEEKLINAWNTRTPMDNIMEKLEYEKERHEKDRKYWSEKSWKDSCIYNECDMSNGKCECFDKAINIVKQEINNGLE